jgi:WD40 repeat protein
MLIIWKLQTDATAQPSPGLGDENDVVEDLEAWLPSSLHRYQFYALSTSFFNDNLRISDNEDIYGLEWSPTGQYLIIGLTDNTAVIFDYHQGKHAFRSLIFCHIIYW